MFLEEELDEKYLEPGAITPTPSVKNPRLYINQDGELCAEGYSPNNVLCRFRFSQETTQKIREFFQKLK